MSRPDGGWMTHRLRPPTNVRRVVNASGAFDDYKSTEIFVRPYSRMARRSGARTRTAITRRSKRRRRAYWRRPNRAL